MRVEIRRPERREETRAKEERRWGGDLKSCKNNNRDKRNQ